MSRMMYRLASHRAHFDYVRGIPEAGRPFEEAIYELTGKSKGGLRLVKNKRNGNPTFKAFRGVSEPRLDWELVLLINDVITQADSTLEAIRAFRNIDIRVPHLVVLIDREQGGIEQVEQTGCIPHAVFTMSDLLDHYVYTGAISTDTADKVKAYALANRI